MAQNATMAEFEALLNESFKIDTSDMNTEEVYELVCRIIDAKLER
jgi:hypothetical protein